MVLVPRTICASPANAPASWPGPCRRHGVAAWPGDRDRDSVSPLAGRARSREGTLGGAGFSRPRAALFRRIFGAHAGRSLSGRGGGRDAEGDRSAPHRGTGRVRCGARSRSHVRRARGCDRGARPRHPIPHRARRPGRLRLRVPWQGRGSVARRRAYARTGTDRALPRGGRRGFSTNGGAEQGRACRARACSHRDLTSGGAAVACALPRSSHARSVCGSLPRARGCTGRGRQWRRRI